jgi:lipopolysaccharide transport system permease protein
MKLLNPDWNQTLLFARQALLDPHRGSVLGVGWMYFQPLVLILIYTLVFSKFMGARLAGITTPYAYSLYLVPGLMLWTAFANTLSAMVGVYQAKAHIIRKIPVNLTIMPAYIALTETINFCIAMVIFGLFCVAIDQPPGLNWLLLVPICISTVGLAYALGLVLAALSPFLPDLRPMSTIVLQLLFWLTPVIYVADILPLWAVHLLDWHPIYWGIHQAQDIVLYGSMSSPRLWAAQALLALVLLLLATRTVKSLEKEIRDLL